jgi:hypothetical protein
MSGSLPVLVNVRKGTKGVVTPTGQFFVTPEGDSATPAVVGQADLLLHVNDRQENHRLPFGRIGLLTRTRQI